MKKPITVICNDWHIKQENEEEVIKSIEHLIKFCLSESIDEVIVAGDIFDVRKTQRLTTLLAWKSIIYLMNDAGILMHIIPGNHDKPDYTSPYSYIDVFNSSDIKYYPHPEKIKIRNISFLMMPFFREDIQAELIAEAEAADIMIGHFELNGSTNLGRVASGRKISSEDLKNWKKVYLGHYHNYHKVTKDIVHLASLRQNNFGEDDKKGFTVVYDDLSHKHIQGEFQRLNVVQIDADKITQKELDDLIKIHSKSDDIVRFKVTGSSSKLKALDKSKITNSGIGIIMNSTDIEFTEKDFVLPTAKHDEDSIEKLFKAFCLENNLSFEVGFSYLQTFLKKENND